MAKARPRFLPYLISLLLIVCVLPLSNLAQPLRRRYHPEIVVSNTQSPTQIFAPQLQAPPSRMPLSPYFAPHLAILVVSYSFRSTALRDQVIAP
ncbi:hypothetical protein K443DRAFT_682959 [Laccaria amethystina LaAM-08-1]|uniref:Unplaced genomic scaffold K443scaffold_218, whole genome shotgun sequence n=1 Tax=Laccaria amethystina LaAM-08-1 TaxID=1095629 RepID=A0A0C9X2U6_9AGAR|nr:hypothetical protein K443DRAFT_682959 [Laccaria amethystina LaAM-08-1]